jgi:predicted nucleic acid-binding protein
MAVIDASIYVAWMNANEPEHASSWAWLMAARSRREPLVAPVILLAEVGSALSRGLGEAQLAQQTVEQLEHSGLIELVPVTLPLARRAAAIAAKYRIRGCDAIYVALAEQRGEELVSLDQQQIERAVQVVATHHL